VYHDSTYVAKKDLPAVDADQLFCSRRIYGPYVFGNYYCVSKSMGKIRIECKTSHILISYEGTQVPNKKNKN
jgi:peptidyl-prolyl cis-trans isomerase D